ncbi:DMT family transporter [Paenibacillus polymyxa]|uniref:DMT family transporter n=1 Tax=Paenibacillus polymyxa TaxID=1406 RepID=A0A8I1LRS5_PAEPO|nr:MULTISPECIES: DMT family transporter [Paenibacillus]KAF6572237.1 DMT family transporter [Paenibacillus sp. EKM206P]KAF6586650.1 DMT family transporter [Paenibacillus sp. EKM205P]KEO78492.1 membrane protein [Paenibacillus polymyxa]MBM0634886.1 DMT family transporter [Paenibacillus polymyxa]MCH6186918.1 DMT family transporter [Paenibacillus polymyxa]
MGELTTAKRMMMIALLVVLWGISWPIYKVALEFTPPLLFAGLRTLLGGLLLGVILVPRWNRIRWKENWRVYAISGIFNVVLFYGLQTVGLMYVPSGLFSVLVYLQPVLVGIFAWMWLGEAMSRLKVLGLVIGFLGVAAVSVGGFSGHVAMAGVILAIITAVSWALGTVYVKKVNQRVDSLWLVAFQCTLGGVVLTGAGTVTESWSDIVWNVPYVSGLIFGTVLGISLSWLLYFTLVNSGDASKVASYTFLVPVISVFVSSLVLGEAITAFLLIGLILIGLSIYLVNRRVRVVRQA